MGTLCLEWMPRKRDFCALALNHKEFHRTSVSVAAKLEGQRARDAVRELTPERKAYKLAYVHSAAGREASRKSASKRRAIAVRATVMELPLDVVGTLRDRDGSACQICQKPLGRGVPHVDHVKPLVRGGAHALWNLRLTHPSCNLSKGKTFPLEARLWLTRHIGR